MTTATQCMRWRAIRPPSPGGVRHEPRRRHWTPGSPGAWSASFLGAAWTPFETFGIWWLNLNLIWICCICFARTASSWMRARQGLASPRTGATSAFSFSEQRLRWLSLDWDGVWIGLDCLVCLLEDLIWIGLWFNFFVNLGLLIGPFNLGQLFN